MFLLRLVHADNEVWGKVMFLHLSVILFMGRVSVKGGLCPGGVSVQWVSVQGVSVWGRSLFWRPPETVKSGRYASYWNALLFY